MSISGNHLPRPLRYLASVVESNIFRSNLRISHVRTANAACHSGGGCRLLFTRRCQQARIQKKPMKRYLSLTYVGLLLPFLPLAGKWKHTGTTEWRKVVAENF